MKYYYILRLFPPLGVLNKYQFENIDMLMLTLANLYDNLNIDKLDISDTEKKDWKKSPLAHFAECVLVTKINTEVCYKHQKLFRDIEKNNKIRIQEIVPLEAIA